MANAGVRATGRSDGTTVRRRAKVAVMASTSPAPLGRGDHGVADADVDLDPKPRRAQVGENRHALAAVDVRAADGTDPNGRRVELETVRLDWHGADLGDGSAQRIGVEIAEAEEIRIARGSDRFTQPYEQHQRALEDKAAGVRGAGQPVEEPLRRVARQHEVGVDPERVRMPNQARLDRLGKTRAHATSASRYGRMTRSTRHARAARSSSSIVKRRSCHASRRASIATSSPTRLRILIRSASVLATL